MSIGPPQQEIEEPEVIEFGIAALSLYLDDSDITFPITSEELLDELDHPEIPIDSTGDTIPLATALERVQQNEFSSEQELQNQLHPVFEAHRDNASNSLVRSIRSLLPF